MQAVVRSIVAHFFIHFGKSIKAEQKNQNEEHTQMETYPTTEEPWPRSLQHPKIIAPPPKVPQNINIVNDVKSFIEPCKYS
jgi:hypothetical protein